MCFDFIYFAMQSERFAFGIFVNDYTSTDK